MRYSVHIDGKHPPAGECGEFPDCSSAVAACRKIIDRFLLQTDEGYSAATLLEHYNRRGAQPRISTDDPNCHFSALQYTAQRVRELAGDLWNETGARTHTDAVETTLTSSEIVARLTALREPRTFGGLTQTGALDCILRLRDGTALRFHRETAGGPVIVTAILPQEHAPSHDDRRLASLRCGSATYLLNPKPALARALETIEEAGPAPSSIELAGYGLTAIPPELWRLTSLRSLYLEENWLAGLPAEIGRLENLETLDISCNRLSSLPKVLGQLIRLKTLRLSANCLTTLPPELFQLPNLSTLLLSRNRLTSLPPWIWRLAALERLHLDCNRISEIPPQIGQLSRLSKLHLDHNRLTTLPLELANLTQLVDWPIPPPRTGRACLPLAIGTASPSRGTASRTSHPISKEMRCSRICPKRETHRRKR
jgi:hypothetical protein